MCCTYVKILELANTVYSYYTRIVDMEHAMVWLLLSRAVYSKYSTGIIDKCHRQDRSHPRYDHNRPDYSSSNNDDVELPYHQ